MVNIVGNSRFYQIWTKLHWNVIYCKTFRIISISVNICKYRGFGKKISKNFDFVEYSWKSRFWSKFMKISILVFQNSRKILILVNIFGKSRFQSISSVKLILVKIFPKSSFGSKFPKNVDLGQKFPKKTILVNIFENLDFGEICLKISNLVKFVEKSRFWSNLSKILNFGQNFKKSVDFSLKIRKCWF